MAAAYLRFATEDAELLELMFAGKHGAGADQLAAAAAPFGLMHDLIVQGQAEGALDPGGPEGLGTVMLATLQGLASLRHGALVAPDRCEGIVEVAVSQFLRNGR